MSLGILGYTGHVGCYGPTPYPYIETCPMPSPVKCQVPAADSTRLQALVAAPMTPQKHVWRCAIVLATAESLGTTAIRRRTGKSKVTVWRWQERYAEAGVDGLLRDRTRPPGKPPVSDAQVQAVLTRTLQPPPGRGL